MAASGYKDGDRLNLLFPINVYVKGSSMRHQSATLEPLRHAGSYPQYDGETSRNDNTGEHEDHTSTSSANLTATGLTTTTTRDQPLMISSSLYIKNISQVSAYVKRGSSACLDWKGLPRHQPLA